MTENWQLFIDESGLFDGEDTDVVGGLLLESADSPALIEALERALRAVYPGVPYPPHATDLNPSGSPVAVALLAEQRGVPVDKGLLKLAHRCRRENKGRAAEFVRAIDEGKLPRFDATKKLDPWIKRLPGRARGSLSRERERQAKYMRRLLGSLSTNVGRAAFVGAGRPSRGAPSSQRGPNANESRHGDSYLELLVAVFERVYALLRDRNSEGVAVLKVHVLGRHVRHSRQRRSMTKAELEAHLQHAELFPLLAPAVGTRDAHLRVQAQRPRGYCDGVHPGLVLADWLCNRARWALADGSSLTSVSQAIERSSALHVSMQSAALPECSPLPTLAAAGRPQAAVKIAFQDPSRARPDPGRGWAGEQAQMWIAAAEQTGGSLRWR